MIGPRLLPTDAMIYAGTKYLFDQAAIPIHQYETINDTEMEDIQVSSYPDLIVVLGTPWVWDKCWLSAKFQNAINFLRKFPNSKKIFFGIGSCLPIEATEEVREDLIQNRNKLDELFTLADQIIVRDSLAEEILEHLSIQMLPCPAFYAINEESESSIDPVMIWYDPTIGISSVNWQKDGKAFSKYCERFLDWYHQYNPRIYCINKQEQQSAIEIGLPKPSIIQGVDRAKLVLKNSNTVLSGRVHFAVPTYKVHSFVELVPVDTRARTFYDVVYGRIKDPFLAENDYMDLLRKL